MKQKTVTSAWLAIIMAFVLNAFVTGFLSGQQGLLIEPVTSGLGMSRTLYSSLISVCSISTSILSLFYAKLQGKAGLKGMAMIGMLGAVLYCFLYVAGGRTSGSAVALMALAQICFGATLAWGGMTTCTSMINTWAAKRRGTLISLVATAASVASIIASPLVAGWITKIGWSGSMLIRGIGSAIVLGLVIVLLKSKPGDGDVLVWEDADEKTGPAAESTEEVSGITMQEVLKARTFWFGVLTTFGVGLFIYPAFLNMAAYASDLGYAANVGTVMSICYAVNIIVTFPMGGLMEKYGCRKIMLIMFALIALGCAIFSMGGISLPMIYAGAALMGVAYATLQVPVAMLAAEIAGPANAIQTQSYYFTAQTVGTILGGPLFGLVYDATGSYQQAFLIDIFAVIVVCVFMFIATSKSGRKAG